LTQSYNNDIRVYVSNDGVVYLNQVQDICTGNNINNDSSNTSSTANTIEITSKSNGFNSIESKWWPIVIFIPLRLGINKINDIYIPTLKETFKFPQSMGIIGGKPRGALYFVAIQNDDVIFLDPHSVNTVVPLDGEHLSTLSYHCDRPLKMPITNLDPSLSLGFYCRDKVQFDDFWKRTQVVMQMDNPIFSVAEQSPNYDTESLHDADDLLFDDSVIEREEGDIIVL